MRFIMDETLISSASLFKKHFSPTEILFNKETAAEFMLLMLAPLSVENYFNAIVFAENTFGPPEKELDNLNYHLFGVARDALAERKNSFYDETLYLKDWFRNPHIFNVLKDVRNIADETDLEDNREKDQLFALLSSAYLLAEKTPLECSVTSTQAQEAFRKISFTKEAVSEQAEKQEASETEPDSSKPDDFEDVTETAAILKETAEERIAFDTAMFTKSENKIRGRNSAYKLKLRASSLLKDGEIIEPRRITADLSVFGDTIPVKLEIYDSNGKEKLEEFQINTGEYLFGNFVGNELICIHPAKAETDSCYVERQGNIITLFNKKNRNEKKQEGLNIVAIVPETVNCGYIGIHTGGAFYDSFSNIDVIMGREKEEGIVQAIVKGEKIYLLHKEGHVYVNMARDWTAPKYADLKGYIKDRKL